MSMMDKLAPGDVALYIARPDLRIAEERIARYGTLLTDEERGRIARFRFESGRDEHFVTRVLMRLALSRHAASEPGAWRFRENEHGRPEIDPPCGLRFNASNSHGLVACAVTESAEVGIDVEPRSRSANILRVAHTVFSPEELDALRGLGAAVDREAGAAGAEAAPPAAPHAAHDRALALWTLKEAYIKARGVGLVLPLQRTTFRFAPDGAVSLVTDRDVDPDPSRWRFHRVQVGEHALAIAVEAGDAGPGVIHPPVALF
jgi:4'-phosphopantetheinyl transferase